VVIAGIGVCPIQGILSWRHGFCGDGFSDMLYLRHFLEAVPIKPEQILSGNEKQNILEAFAFLFLFSNNGTEFRAFHFPSRCSMT
jgi:hypothetical protein